MADGEGYERLIRRQAVDLARGAYETGASQTEALDAARKYTAAHLHPSVVGRGLEVKTMRTQRDDASTHPSLWNQLGRRIATRIEEINAIADRLHTRWISPQLQEAPVPVEPPRRGGIAI